ncbi:MAG TPA: FAD-dependent oxidoreductase [Candidatus Limnocylindria bacterium]|nr:FAD-dependent oxidoreductase [Candidatus Limnocylindria bacterium]
MSAAIDRVVVVGGGLAGGTAAFALREAGFEGAVTLVAEEPHLPYERPPLSKAYLRGEENAEAFVVRPEAAYDDEGVTLILGRRAMTIDRTERTVELDGGERLAYDRLILATGAAPRALAGGAHLPGVHVLRTLDDAEAIRSALGAADRVVVVGGGWIGAEVAASLRQLGATVTLVTNLPRPLERVLGSEIGEVYAGLHREHGVELVAGHVAGIVGEERASAVQLSDGRRLPADLVVVGVGVTPRIELARRADLAIAEGGVAVDARLQSSDPAIYAAGDIAAADHPRLGRRLRIEHWDNAKRQGRAAARNAIGFDEPYDRTPYFFSDQYDLGIEVRGLPPPGADVVIRGDPASRSFVAFWVQDGRVAAALNANVWDAGKELAALVKDAAEVDPKRLADPGMPMSAVAA